MMLKSSQIDSAAGFISTQTAAKVSEEYNLDGLENIDKFVFDHLQLPSSLAQEKGVHWNEIAQKLKVSQEKIIEAIESLESQGLVYSTIDEFHYKSLPLKS